MNQTSEAVRVKSGMKDGLAVVYAGDYLNKLSGEKIERECQRQLERGCRALVLSFKETELVNSIGVSILMGVIESAEKFGAKLVFYDVSEDTTDLFEMLGVTRHVNILPNENLALSILNEKLKFQN